MLVHQCFLGHEILSGFSAKRLRDQRRAVQRRHGVHRDVYGHRLFRRGGPMRRKNGDVQPNLVIVTKKDRC